jgi:hypothetical protein
VSDIEKPHSAISTDGDETTKAASSFNNSSVEDKLAMAKQFLAAMETDDLKKLFQTVLGSASPEAGGGVDG